VAPVTRQLGRSAVGLFVHRDNPCTGLTSAQLVAALRGTLTWADLGVAGPLAALPVLVVANHPASGATTQLAETLFDGGPLPQAVRCELVGSSVVQAAAIDPAVLAVAAVHQATPAVRLVALDGIAAEPAAIADGSYRLSRPLLIAWLPHAPPDPGLAALLGALDDPAAARVLGGLGVR
jgi:ABC-type phosphate transport system substrate-binding protein